ncbi:regucalcin [Hygrophoropsis aurantiaca]|uniref:Regucalcin n=1 Tax=Hygrophoropsis aurantiaca TaxID=72124 RepID=A0ACB8AG55_9AGAM|nr:regucalcin [Hygrophoropsis aurantiaca]
MSAIKTFLVERPLVTVGCTLGEAPLYDPQTGILHFVDIVEHKVYHLNTQDLQISSETFDLPITSLALRRDGKGLACTTAQGFAILEGNSRLQHLCKPLPQDHVPHVRFNDGACDSSGRFFAGSVFSKEQGIPGQLWMYDPATSECIVVDEGPFTDSNGLGWSPDGTTLYFTDSLLNHIHAYDYDNGKLSNRRVAIDAMAAGLPEQSFCDGLCIDSEGYIWSARWGGSRINRFTPDGKVDAEIIFPKALNITACCFGGPKEDQLYVTTAHCGAINGDPSRQDKYPDSGHLFVVDLSGQYRGGQWRHEFGG